MSDVLTSTQQTSGTPPQWGMTHGTGTVTHHQPPTFFCCSCLTLTLEQDLAARIEQTPVQWDLDLTVGN